MDPGLKIAGVTNKGW